MEKHERLRMARERRGFESAAQAAEYLGVPYGSYSGHENGSRGFKDDSLSHYARAFRVSAGWLATGEGAIDPSPHQEHSRTPAPKRPASQRDAALGVRVKIARLYAGWSRAGFATHLGVSRNTIFQWEKGNSQPTDDNQEKIARVTSTRVEWLKKGQGEMTAEIHDFSSNVASRLRYSRARLSMTREDLASLSGVPVEVVEAIETGQTSYAQNAMQLAEALRISADWLRTGHTDDQKLQTTEHAHHEKVLSSESEPGKMDSAGAAIAMQLHSGEVLEIDSRRPKKRDEGEVHVFDGPWRIPPDFLSENKVSPHSRVIDVVGDGMAPTMIEGESVLVDTTRTEPDVPGIYAIERGRSVFFARLQLIDGTRPPQVEVIFDNSKYKTLTVPVAQLKIIGMATKAIALKEIGT